TSELAGKRLELLRMLVPQAARVAVPVNPANVAAIETQLKDVGAAARAIGLQIQIHNANTSAEIDAAFERNLAGCWTCRTGTASIARWCERPCASSISSTGTAHASISPSRATRRTAAMWSTP